MASASNTVILARVVPQGPEAEDALDFVYNDKSLSNRHRFFIHADLGPRDRLRDSESDSSSPSNR